MRVAFVVSGFPVLSQTFVTLQLAGLVRREIDVKVINLGRQGDSSIACDFGVQAVPVFQAFTVSGKQLKKKKLLVLGKIFYFLMKKPAFLFSAIKSSNGYKPFAELLTQAFCFRESENVDVIHCQFSTLAEVGVRLRKLGFFKSSPIVCCSVRGFDVSSKKYSDQVNWLELFNEVDVFLPVSESLKGQLCSRGYGGPAVVIRSPINIDVAQEVERTAEDVRSDCELQIISVGRLVEKKGIDDALEALLAFKNAGYKFHYTIVGDGPLADAFKKTISKNGFEDCVTMTGALSQKDALTLMSKCDVFLAPCKTAKNGDMEGIPNVIKEAMYFGLQVLSTRHSGIPELVEHSKTGFLVDEGSPQQIFEMLEFISQNREAWPEAARAAKNAVIDTYSIQGTTDSLISVYEEFLGGNR